MVKLQIPKSKAETKTKRIIVDEDSDSSGVVRINTKSKNINKSSDSSDDHLFKTKITENKNKAHLGEEKQKKKINEVRIITKNKKDEASSGDEVEKSDENTKKMNDIENDKKNILTKKKKKKSEKNENQNLKNSQEMISRSKKNVNDGSEEIIITGNLEKPLSQKENIDDEEKLVKKNIKKHEGKNKQYKDDSGEALVKGKKTQNIKIDSGLADNKKKNLKKELISSEHDSEKSLTKTKINKTKKLSDSEKLKNSSDPEEENIVVKTKDSKKKSENANKIDSVEVPQKRKVSDALILDQVVKQKISETESILISRETELFIGGLAYEATENDLKMLFSPFGEINNISIPTSNGMSKGIAFISFTTTEAATSALSMNGSEFMGRALRVNLSSNKPDRKPGFSSENSCTLFVGNLSYGITEDSVREFFSGCGTIKDIRFALTPEGKQKGFAHVEFTDKESANQGLKLMGKALNGRSVKIDIASEIPSSHIGLGRKIHKPRFNTTIQTQSKGKKIKL